MKSAFEFDVRLARDIRAPAAARHLIDGLAGDIPAEVLERFRITASELVTNVLMFDPGSPEPVRMVASIGPLCLRLQVLAWDPRIDADGARSDASRRSTWGMLLIDRMADRWGVDRNGEPVIWCEFDIELADVDEVETRARWAS